MIDTPETAIMNRKSTRLILAELQRQSDFHLESSDIVDEKAARLLEWSSVALAVVSAVSAPGMIGAGKLAPLIVLLAASLLYVFIVAVCLKILLPRDYQLPVGPNWDEMHDLYLINSEQKALEQLLSQYLLVIEMNRVTVERKAEWLNMGYRLFPALALLLTVMATSSLWQGWFA